MQSRQAGLEVSDPDRASPLASFLFLAILSFLLITTSPFADLSTLSHTDPQAGNSSALNQVAALLVSGGLIAYGLRHPLGLAAILQPRLLLVPLFIWFVLVSLISDDPATALRKIVPALLLSIDASLLLLLPRDQKHFAKLLLLAMGVMLAVAYFGVVALPGRAIHQFSDAVEPEHAGLWHGQFPHKNVAAAVMVMSALVGLFVASSGYRLGGFAVVVLSTVFLLHTGGKSAIAYLPATLLVAWIFEHWRWSRVPVAIVGPLCFNALAIGCALSDRIGAFVESVGIDPTFTARTDIWRVALEAIARRPITGYGFKAFWQTDALFYGGGAMETWAVRAFNGHNSWIDLVLTTGLPSFVLVVIWLVLLPLRDIRRAETAGGDPALTRLFMRLWLYGLFSACLETSFFQSGDPLWFAMMFSVAGLRLQGSLRLRRPVPSRAAPFPGGTGQRSAASPPFDGEGRRPALPDETMRPATAQRE